MNTSDFSGNMSPNFDDQDPVFDGLFDEDDYNIAEIYASIPGDDWQ